MSSGQLVKKWPASMAVHQVESAGENREAWLKAMRSARLGLLITALAVLGVLAISGVSATDNGGAETALGRRLPDVRTMQSLYFTVTVLALNNAVHP